jgi:hypothetical protein
MKHYLAVLLPALCTPLCLCAEPHPDSHSILFDASYGERLPGSTAAVELWWASSGWKVCKCRPAPTYQSKAIEIRAARNEWEAAQLVVRPSIPLKDFIAASTALIGPDGATIDAEHIEVLRVRYVTIQRKTDKWSALAPWPDPLPPFKGPLDLQPDPKAPNQPLWIRAYVPKGAPAGIYEGVIQLFAEGYAAEVPLRVEVYDFELPDRLTCTTAFGFNPSTVWQYQKVSDPAQKREVLEKYWDSFREHRISPYNPAPFDGYKVEWVKLSADEAARYPEAERVMRQNHEITPRFDWAAWDAEVDRVFAKHHFSTILLGVPGLGGGTFYGHSQPSLQGFAADTPEYWAAFSAYCGQLERHIREKGLLDAGYVYWFDEPTPPQYPHVMRGFELIKKAAPDLRRMLTEEVKPELVGGPNLWCSLTRTYNHEAAEARRTAGDHFWWYICTTPKQPFATEFIDHPGTALRVWLWQTWQNKIEGILIWHSNLWTTGTAYPDHPQNPYEDPMSWVSGYGTKPGDRRPWGNGDGRFMYPPEAAADANPPEPVLDGPVDSVRWEMLRDGLEDYEYMTILARLFEERGEGLSSRKRKRVEKLLVVPDAITSDLKTFTKDPAPIEKHRHLVARAIEQLTASN